MIDLLDSHTHSIMSGHAYSTINEMIQAGKKKGLKLLAFTEHAPEMDGACRKIYFRNLNIMPRKQEGLITLYGVELNILDPEGHVDLPDDILEGLDVVVASIHPPVFQADEEIEDYTPTYIRAMSNPYVNIIGHPDDGRIPVDYGELVRAAKAYHVLLEVNNSSYTSTTARTNTRENCKKMLKECMRYQAPIIVNSDAHADFLVGEHTEGMALLEEVGFPEELVVNTNLDLYFSYLSVNPIYLD